jgi:hypothetical protein
MQRQERLRTTTKTFSWHECLLLARHLQAAAPSPKWAVVLDVSHAGGKQQAPEIVSAASQGLYRPEQATPPVQHAVWALLHALLAALAAPTARVA